MNQMKLRYFSVIKFRRKLYQEQSICFGKLENCYGLLSLVWFVFVALKLELIAAILRFSKHSFKFLCELITAHDYTRT